MSKDVEGLQDWQPCPDGMLSQCALRHSRRLARRRFLVAGLGCGALLAVAIGLRTHFTNSPLEPNYGGIVCSQVRANLAAYKAGTIKSSIRDRIVKHVRLCPICRDLLAKSGDNRPAARDLANFSVSGPHVRAGALQSAKSLRNLAHL